jgi:hypothetical protein
VTVPIAASALQARSWQRKRCRPGCASTRVRLTRWPGSPHPGQPRFSPGRYVEWCGRRHRQRQPGPTVSPRLTGSMAGRRLVARRQVPTGLRRLQCSTEGVSRHFSSSARGLRPQPPPPLMTIRSAQQQQGPGFPLVKPLLALRRRAWLMSGARHSLLLVRFNGVCEGHGALAYRTGLTNDFERCLDRVAGQDASSISSICG